MKASDMRAWLKERGVKPKGGSLKKQVDEVKARKGPGRHLETKGPDNAH